MITKILLWMLYITATFPLIFIMYSYIRELIRIKLKSKKRYKYEFSFLKGKESLDNLRKQINERTKDLRKKKSDIIKEISIMPKIEDLRGLKEMKQKVLEEIEDRIKLIEKEEVKKYLKSFPMLFYIWSDEIKSYKDIKDNKDILKIYELISKKYGKDKFLFIFPYGEDEFLNFLYYIDGMTRIRPYFKEGIKVGYIGRKPDIFNKSVEDLVEIIELEEENS